MNPRSLGMAGAGIALKGDVFSGASNPAGLTSLDNFEIGFCQLMLGAGIQQSYLSTQFKTKGEATAGFVINSLNSGQMKVRTEFQPDGTGNYFSVSQTAVAGNYAQKLTEMFSFGVTGKFIYENMAGYTATTLGVDLGFLYETDFNNLKFAVVLQNFGGNTSSNGDQTQVSYNRNGELNLGRYTLPTTFRMGLSADIWKKENHLIIGSLELNNPNDNAENVRIGFQYSFRELLEVQTGYKISVSGQTLPTFGTTYKTRIGVHPIRIQYAMNPTNNMGTQHLIGIRWTQNKMGH